MLNTSTNLEAYKDQQDTLLQKYEGKILAIHDGKLAGVFDSKVEALIEMKEKFEAGSFLIIKCTKGDSEYTRRFRSRVMLTNTSFVGACA